MRKSVKKAAGGGDGMKLPNMGSTKTVDQHKRMATGHGANQPLKKGGRTKACK